MYVVDYVSFTIILFQLGLTKSEIKAILLSNNVFSYNCIYDKRDNSIKLSSLVSRTINSKSELSELFKLFYLTIDKMRILNLIK